MTSSIVQRSGRDPLHFLFLLYRGGWWDITNSSVRKAIILTRTHNIMSTAAPINSLNCLLHFESIPQEMYGVIQGKYLNGM